MELLHDSFFNVGFLSPFSRIPSFVSPNYYGNSFYDDPFFRFPVSSGSFYDDCGLDFNDHFLTFEGVDSEEGDVKMVDDNGKSKKDNNNDEMREKGNESRFFYESSNYLIDKMGTKRGINTHRSGDSETGKEKYSIRKTIGDKSLTITKEMKDGKEEISKDYKNIRKGEIDQFLNDWENFSIDKDMKPKKIEMKKKISHPEEEKKEIVEKKENQQEKQMNDIHHTPNQRDCYYTRIVKSSTINGKTRGIEEIKEKTKEGEICTVIKTLGDQKLVIKTMKDDKESQKVNKFFEKIDNEKDEKKFLLEWEEFGKKRRNEEKELGNTNKLKRKRNEEKKENANEKEKKKRKL